METRRDILNPKSHIARVGEVYELTFTLIGIPFLEAPQTAVILTKINSDERFKVKNIDSRAGTLIVTVEIIKNPFPIIIVIEAVTVSLIGLFIYLSLGKVEQIINTPEGKTNNLATSLGISAAIVVLAGALLKKVG